jgi:hypothetical protein
MLKDYEKCEENQVTAEFILEKFATKCFEHLITGQKLML